MSDIAHQPAAEFLPAAEGFDAPNFLQRVMNIAALGIVATEVTPANEALRLGALGIVEHAAHNPYMTTGAVTGATFVIEASASVATAALMNTERGQKITQWVGDKAGKIRIGKNGVQSGPVTDLAIGTMFGSAVATFTKHAQDPDRTRAQNIRFGVENAAEVAAVVAPGAYLASESIQNPSAVGVTALSVAAVAGGVVAVRKIHNRRKNRARAHETITAQSEAENVETFTVRYDLSPEELRVAEAEMVHEVRRQNGNRVTAVWLSSTSKYSNVIRTLEAEIFPDIPDIMKDDETQSAFLAIVDTRKSAGEGRIVRGTRISSPMLGKAASDGTVEEVKTAMIHGLINSGQITEQEILDYYSQPGVKVDLHHTVSVETNFRVGERSKRVWGIPLAHLAYLSMVKYGLSLVEDKEATPSILAHANDDTIDSMRRLGADTIPFAGRSDLHTPDAEGGFDDKYRPVCIPYTPQTKKALRRIRPFALRDMHL